MTQKKANEDPAPSVNEFTFLDHLEELRWLLIKSFLALIAGCFLFYPFSDPAVRYLIQPIGKLVFTSPADAFLLKFKMIFGGGILLASPIILYQIWQFVASALKDREKKFVGWAAPGSVILFLAGCAFGYFLMIPMSVNFLLGFSSDVLVPMITAESYFSFLTNFVLGFGIAFQLPLILAFLIWIGVATPAFLAHYRKFAFVGIFVVSAILTPPDVVSQLLMAVPLIVLYEISVAVSKLVYKERLNPSHATNSP